MKRPPTWCVGAVNSRLSAQAESTREMVDALRGLLGMDPLYAVDERALERRRRRDARAQQSAN